MESRRAGGACVHPFLRTSFRLSLCCGSSVLRAPKQRPSQACLLYSLPAAGGLFTGKLLFLPAVNSHIPSGAYAWNMWSNEWGHPVWLTCARAPVKQSKVFFTLFVLLFSLVSNLLRFCYDPTKMDSWRINSSSTSVQYDVVTWVNSDHSHVIITGAEAKQQIFMRTTSHTARDTM